MSSEEGKSRAAAMGGAGDLRHPPPPPPQSFHQQQPYQYGTFGVPDYSQPAIGFPQPAPPPGAGAPSAPPYLPPHPSGPQYYAHGYQAIPGYAVVAEGRPLRMRRLPCCGIGVGWLLFILGFFLAAVPWYVGAFILLCVRIDYREKPGFVACTIGAVLAAIAVLLGVTKGTNVW